MKKIYLATPHSGTPAQQGARFIQASIIAGEIIKQGHCVFSPISHSHPIHKYCNLPGDHGYWQRLNESWLEWCDEVWVAEMDGWKQSKGVRWEMDWSEKNGKPVVMYPVK